MAVSRNHAGNVPVVEDVFSSHKQEIHPATSLGENRIEFEVQTDRNFYVDLIQTYLALKQKMVKCPGCETYNTTEVQKEHKDQSKGNGKEDTRDEEVGEDPPFPMVTHLKLM